MSNELETPVETLIKVKQEIELILNDVNSSESTKRQLRLLIIKTDIDKQVYRHKEFDNQQRTRYYGKRRGDIVTSQYIIGLEGEIVDYGFMDNNRVYVRWGGKPELVAEVAEWLHIATKVEDRKK